MWKLIDKIGLFLQNLFTALKFAVFDYDVTLRRTKTDKQRIIIWVSIFIVTVGLGYALLLLLSHYIRTVMDNRFL
jgi:hypothetical protein